MSSATKRSFSQFQSNGPTSQIDDRDFKKQRVEDDLPEIFKDENEEPVCPQCQSKNIMEDPRQGSVVCGDCGEILDTTFILHTAPARVISDDPKTHGRVHHGDAYNPYEEYTLTERSNLTRDEKEFLWQGQNEINDALQTLFKTEVNHAVRDRAIELFNKSFGVQMKEKQAHLQDASNHSTAITEVSSDLKAKKEKKKEEKDSESKTRQRFSRKRQFVVTVLGVSLSENIPKIVKKDGKEVKMPWSISEICKLVPPGKEIKEASIRRCLKDLNIDQDFFSTKK